MSHSDYKNLYEGYLDNTGYNNRNIRENYAVGFTQCSGNGYWGWFESTDSKITRCKNANKNSNCAYDSSCGVIPLFNKELNFQIQINNNKPKSVDQTLRIEANVGDIIQLTSGSFNITNNPINDSVYDYINTGGSGGSGVFEVIGSLPPGIKKGSLIKPGEPDVVIGPGYNGTFSGKIEKPTSKAISSTGKAGVKNTWIYMFTIKLKYTDPSDVVIYQEKKIQFNIEEKY
jgi:hypothetical protein